MNLFEPPPLHAVRVTDPFFAPRIEANRGVTIPASLQRCRETGRLDAFKLEWTKGQANPPHIFWDSDVAKVLEGMAYALRLDPDPDLERTLNDIVDQVVAAQGPDGYLNTYFSVVEPDKRWTRLHHDHELYCAGHLMEAAVAHYETTGRRTFLDGMCRYADCIARVFGRGPRQIRGYPGHEEIELALCRLSAATGRKKYLRLAQFFIDERGRAPNDFIHREHISPAEAETLQAHRPVREQEEAVGHAVRAVYLYAGMADVAAATGDASLLRACEKLFWNIAEKKMYLTGGIGSSRHGERFEEEYKLPNATAYAESCAAIGLVLLARRLHHLTGNAAYAEVMERALYNGVFSGISLRGDAFFYQNMLQCNARTPYSRTRQPWFDCSCCPTNFCRFTPQIGSLLWACNAQEVRLLIPAASRIAAGDRVIDVRGKYPYDGDVSIRFGSDATFTFSMRIPTGSTKIRLSLNGKPLKVSARSGFISLSRSWRRGDELHAAFDLPVRTVRAHPRVDANLGRLALMRGPLVYALEQHEHAAALDALVVPEAQAFTLHRARGLPRDVVAIRGSAFEEIDRNAGALYGPRPPRRRKCSFTAIPYALWQNRGETDMTVWVRAADRGTG